MKRTLNCCLLASYISIFFLSGCARNISPNTYTGNSVGTVQLVKPGVILAKRTITIDNTTPIGVLGGATAGAAAGSLIGGNTAVNVIGAVGGVVIGGAVGNTVDKAINTHTGTEYIIKLDAGPTISVVQTEELQLSIKQHVLVLYGEMTRIISDNVNATQHTH
jgi:outer membrane lipoprotein SlyB